MKNEEIIIKEFPKLFQSNPNEPISHWGIECNDGWYNIIYNLCAEVSKLIPQGQEDEYYVCQIKEKFGTLRFYMSLTTPEINEAINVAETKSAYVCEVCGKPGKTKNIGYWLKTICDVDEIKLIKDRGR